MAIIKNVIKYQMFYKNKNIPPFCNVLRLKQKTEKI